MWEACYSCLGGEQFFHHHFGFWKAWWMFFRHYKSVGCCLKYGVESMFSCLHLSLQFDRLFRLRSISYGMCVFACMVI